MSLIVGCGDTVLMILSDGCPKNVKSHVVRTTFNFVSVPSYGTAGGA